MERHPAMIGQNHMDGCLPCQNGTVRNPQIRWRLKGTGAAPPVWCRHRMPDPMPSPPGTSPASLGPIRGTERSQNDNLPAANADPHVPLPKTQLPNLNALSEDSLNDEDCDPELLTDERTSCGWYTIFCVRMLLKYILKTRAAYWTYMSTETSIDRKERDC